MNEPGLAWESGISYSCGVENYSAWIWPLDCCVTGWLAGWPGVGARSPRLCEATKQASKARLQLVLPSVSPSAGGRVTSEDLCDDTKGVLFQKVLLL